MPKETPAAPEQSYFSKFVSVASLGAAAVQKAAVVVGSIGAGIYSSYNKKVEQPRPAKKPKHKGFASKFKVNNRFKKKTPDREAFGNNFGNNFDNSFDRDEAHERFREKPPASIAQTVYGGLKKLWYAAGLPKTKEDQEVLEAKEKWAEMMKAKHYPPGQGPAFGEYEHVDRPGPFFQKRRS